MDILRIVIQSLVSLGVLWGLTRMIGKCSISQLEPFDYINSITIGDLAGELATAPKGQWPLPLTAMLVYSSITTLVGLLRCKSLWFRAATDGRPVVLFAHGVLEKKNLLKEKIDLNTFLAQCRLAGYFDLDQLEYAILEPNGQISFLPKSVARPATPDDLQLTPARDELFYGLILDGKVQDENLKLIGQNRQWLQNRLHSAGIGQIGEVFYACSDVQGNFRAYRASAKER